MSLFKRFRRISVPGPDSEDVSPKPALLSRVIVAISRLCFRRPRLASVICWMTCALGFLLASHRLELRMDWTYLFYPDEPIVVAGQLFRESFPLPGDVAVLVDHGDPEMRRVFIDRLAKRLEAEPELFHHVFYRFDLSSIARKALYYLDEQQLKELAQGIEALSSAGPDAASMGGVGASRQVMLKLMSDLDLALQTRGRATYIPIWETLADDADGRDSVDYLGPLVRGEPYIYPTLGDGQIGFVAAKAGTFGNEFANASPMVVRLREILDELRPTTGTLRIRLTGLPVLLHDERETVATDGFRSTLVSLLLVVLVFALGFRELKRPVLAVLALICGMGWTAGFTTLAIGHLNFISVTLTTMLMGIGIDFGIHFIFRYDEEMAAGETAEQAIVRTLEGTGVDTLVGAAATAAAFLALTQANFRGISDFGIIAAGGTFLCFLSTITVLPALLAMFPSAARRKVEPSKDVALLEQTMLRNSGWVVSFWVLLTVGSCFVATRVGFSYNLLEIQAQEIPTVQTELEMVRERNTVLAAEAIATSPQQAREQFDRLAALPSVARISSILPLLPVVSASKQARIEAIVLELRRLQMPKPVSLETVEDLLVLRQRLQELERSVPSHRNDQELLREVERLKQKIAEMDPGPIQDALKDFQSKVRGDLAQTLGFLQKQTAQPPTLQDLPDELVLRYVSRDGKFRQNIQPVKDIWQQEHLDEFLGQLKSVEPRVMGHPVIQEAILSAFHRTLDRTPWFSLLGVLVVFTVYLRKPRAVFLSLLPASLAVLMIFATMGMLGLDFNVVNFVGIPISVGLGAVYGVHSLHRMRELGDETVLTSSTGPALLLSGVTDIVGFASLMTAQHRGISSLGLVLSVGIGVSFITSLVLLPTIRRFWRQRERRRAAANS